MTNKIVSILANLLSGYFSIAISAITKPAISRKPATIATSVNNIKLPIIQHARAAIHRSLPHSLLSSLELGIGLGFW